MADTMTAAAPDKTTLRAEMEAMLANYKELVGQIGDANWKRATGIPAWTCGQLAWHLASSVPFLAGTVDAATQGKSRRSEEPV